MPNCTGINKLTGRICGRDVVPGLDKCEKHAKRGDMLTIILSQSQQIDQLLYRTGKLESRLKYVDREQTRLVSEIKKHL